MWKLNNTLTYNTWGKEEMIKGSLYFELNRKRKNIKIQATKFATSKIMILGFILCNQKKKGKLNIKQKKGNNKDQCKSH